MVARPHRGKPYAHGPRCGRAIGGIAVPRSPASPRCRPRRSSPTPSAAAAPFHGQPPFDGAASPAAAAVAALEPDGIIDPDGRVVKQAPHDPEQLRLLWKAAIKLPMYSVGLMPILVSATAAYLDTGAFAPLRTLGLLVSAVAVIAWLNLSNDVYDSMTGVDSAGRKPESMVALTGSRWKVFLAAHVLLLTGGALLFHLLSAVPNAIVPKALYAAICCGYLYQGPPFRWSYLGLGEPLCFLAFGPLATCAFYLAQVPAAAATPAGPSLAATLHLLPPSAVALAVLVGVSTTVILFCSHFHQVEGDRAAGKLSPLVRLGTRAGAEALKFAVGATYSVTLVLSLFGVLPFAVWTSAMVSYSFASEMVKLAEAHPDDPARLRPLKVLATRWHIAFCCMLILGLLVKKMMVM